MQKNQKSASLKLERRRQLDKFRIEDMNKSEALYYSRLFYDKLPIDVLKLIGSWLPVWDYLSLRRACRYFSQLDRIPSLRFCAYVETHERFGTDQLLSEYRIKLSSECMSFETLKFMADKCHAKKFVRMLNITRTTKEDAQALLVIVLNNDQFDRPNSGSCFLLVNMIQHRNTWLR